MVIYDLGQCRGSTRAIGSSRREEVLAAGSLSRRVMRLVLLVGVLASLHVFLPLTSAQRPNDSRSTRVADRSY